MKRIIGSTALAAAASPALAHPGHGAAWDHLHGPELLLWAGLAVALGLGALVLARRG